MIVEMGTVAAQFLFWECLFLIFRIGSYQCIARLVEEGVEEATGVVWGVDHIATGVGQ
jgi:hypothetical protein